MRRDRTKKEKRLHNRLFCSISVLVVLFPLIRLFIFDRYYDVEQFFVPDAYNYDVGSYAELGSSKVIQQFFSRDDNLAGVDIQLSGKKDLVSWELVDQTGTTLRAGEVKNAGESRITKVRFQPIKQSKGSFYQITFPMSDLGSGVLIAYSNREYCNDCDLSINDSSVNGNLNIVPVYRSSDPFQFIELVIDRVFISATGDS